MKIKLLFLLLFFPWFVFAQSNLNAGFVSGIWYSNFPFFAGDTVRIYAAIQNNSSFDIIGQVRFFNNENSLGDASFSAVKGRVVETWVDWQAREGNHQITAEIIQAMKVEVGKNPEPISLSFAKASQESIFVDVDTDKDAIGNQEDPDDDNDTLSDTQEKKLGTNPLEKDTDQDGIDDATEIQQGTNPLGKESSTQNTQSNLPSFAQELPEVITQEVFPKTVRTIDQVMQSVVKRLEEKQAKIKARAQENQQEPLLAGAIRTVEEKSNVDLPEEKTPTLDQLTSFMLAGAIFTLTSWKMSFPIIFILLLILYFRRKRSSANLD